MAVSFVYCWRFIFPSILKPREMACDTVVFNSGTLSFHVLYLFILLLFSIYLVWIKFILLWLIFLSQLLSVFISFQFQKKNLIIRNIREDANILSYLVKDFYLLFLSQKIEIPIDAAYTRYWVVRRKKNSVLPLPQLTLCRAWNKKV